METKQKYIIIQCSGCSEIENEVNNHIESGYIPIGGICLIDIRSSYLYAQAMILSELKNG